jgi:hypothetical protein
MRLISSDQRRDRGDQRGPWPHQDSGPGLETGSATAKSVPRFHRSDVVFAAALVVICGLSVWVGIAPLRLFEHDTFVLLDNGYRVAQGQVPHRDFSSAWGPAIYLIEAAACSSPECGRRVSDAPTPCSER